MHDIYELKEMLMNELEEYGSKGELSAGSLDIIDKLAHTIKNLCKIIEADEEEYSSYNMMNGSYQDGSNTNGYQNGRSNRPYRGRSYARRGRYSRANEDIVESLRGMMSELPQDTQRDAQKLIQKLEMM